MMSTGELIILGALAFLLVVGTKGKAAAPAAEEAAAPVVAKPSALRWMERGG